LLHSVEQVSWQDCTEWLERAGLRLPTEAQWEYGARAGTHTPWWTGAERESLRTQRAANLADQAVLRLQARWENSVRDWPELDDGYPVHAPIGTYAANPFGLHEGTGNVFEWCQDAYMGDFYARSPRKDPVSTWSGDVPRVCRGGGFMFTAAQARSAYRFGDTPSLRGYGLGVRPARAVEPWRRSEDVDAAVRPPGLRAASQSWRTARGAARPRIVAAPRPRSSLRSA